MKKLLSLLLVALLAIGALSLAACFPGETPDNGGEETPIEYDLEGAKEFLLGYFEDESTVTPSDYTVPAQLPVGDYNYVVTWTTDRDDITITVENGMAKIDLNEKTPEEITYTLTATIADGDGNTITYTRTCTIPAYLVVSFEDYMAANKGDVLTIEGIVVAMNGKSVGNSRNHLFLADAEGKGGYYCYQLDDDPVAAGVEIGMTVSVTATVEPYSGMQELKGGTFQIVSTEKTTVNPVDITTKFAAGESLKNLVGLPVTVQGVEIGRQVLGGTSEYLYFALNGKEGYVRTYITDFPHNMSHETKDNPDKIAIDTAHAEKFGWTANVTGILILYNSNPYLIPLGTDCFEYLELVEKTAEEKVDIELDAITLPGAYNADAEVTVPTVGNYYPTEAVIAWASNNAAIAYADGKLTITVPETDALTVEVTVTVTVGEVTKTKTFTITLSKAPITIPEALALADGSNVLVSGTVVKINTAWSDQYNNISVTIADEEGNELYLYRLATKVVVGDVITVKGVMATYNNARQVAAGATAEITDPAPVEVSLTEAVALADGRRVIVKGTVKSIDTAWSEQYGNITVTIEDEAGNTLYIYRLKTNVQVGDSVIITGKVGSYNGAKQIAAGATAEIVTDDNTGDDNTGDDNTGDDNTGDDNTGDTTVVNTILGALSAEVGAAVEITGTVSEFYQTWNTQYNNCSPYIVDEAGNKIIVFRCKTDVKVGDVIKVVGVIGQYNSVNQIAEGSTVTIVTAHVCSTFTDADCLNAAKCTVCDKANGEALGHSYTDGACTRCGATQATTTVTASKTIAELIAALGWTSSTTKQTFTLDDNVTVKINGGNNTGKAYNNDHIRIYATDSPAGTITISVPEGYELVSIKITTETGTYAILVLEDGTVDICNTTVAVSGNSVTLNSVKVGSDGKQVRVTAIEVVYKPAD